MHGTVIKSTGSWYLVRTDDGRAVECKVKGNFRLRGIRSTNPVAVGDGVTIKEQSGETGEAAFITEIDERRNYIIRKASNLSKQSHILAANVDMALHHRTPRNKHHFYRPLPSLGRSLQSARMLSFQQDGRPF